MMAAGMPPDVFYLPPEMLRERFASLKLIAPLDEQFAGEPQAWKDDFFPIMLNAWRYNVATDKTGDPNATLYGLPKDFTTAVMYVNVDLFNKAGIPVPYKGWTWDEYQADIKKITELTGTPGGRRPHDLRRLHRNLARHGPQHSSGPTAGIFSAPAVFAM